MKARVLTFIALAAALSLAVGIGTASASTKSPSAGPHIGVASSGLGRILVDGRGRTLYLFEKDNHGKSTCTGQCAAFWPPVIASGKPLAVRGAKASLLGTTKRSDGRLQVTYNHHPLYTFVKDVRRGQTSGEGVEAFGAEWYAVSSRGATVEKAAVTANTDSPAAGASGGYGSYGY